MEDKYPIKQLSEELNIKYSTCKTILNTYFTTGRKEKKKTRISKAKIRSKEGGNSPKIKSEERDMSENVLREEQLLLDNFESAMSENNQNRKEHVNNVTVEERKLGVQGNNLEAEIRLPKIDYSQIIENSQSKGDKGGSGEKEENEGLEMFRAGVNFSIYERRIMGSWKMRHPRQQTLTTQNGLPYSNLYYFPLPQHPYSFNTYRRPTSSYSFPQHN